MTNGEAINWIINISADIGKAEHSDLWHYEQALSEIRDMLESTQPENKELSAWQEDFRGYIETLNLPRDDYKGIMEYINEMPSAQPTLYGYDIEHLMQIAVVLREENLPPERVIEALTDMGRIVSIVRNEYEEVFRKAVEQWKF